MVITSRLIACVITALVCLSAVKCRSKYQVCVVDGRGSFKKAARYCPILDEPDSKVECVIGLDRLDCLRRIAKGKADFSVFTPEDLVTASNLQVEVLITNEMRFTNDEFEYEVVAVINDEAGIKNRYDLRDKRFCHPGYGYEADWTRILANYLEVSVVPQTCSPFLTLTENRIKASSKYFKSACKAGPWVNEPVLDQQLKQKYPNLCELCNSPRHCSIDDKYWGRSGPLLCLTDGAGDVSWSRLDDVRSHFGLTPGPAIASPKGYSYLCPNGTIIPLNSTSKPCVWVAKPWPVVATKRTSAQDIQELMASLSHVEPNSWKSSLLNLIETYHLNIKSLDPIEAIESYLAIPTGFLSANSFPGCHPPRTIRICTTSNLENAKCGWLREAAAVYGIEPDIDCVKADNKTHCMQGIADDLADLVILPPDMINLAKTNYSLKTLFYETANDEGGYSPANLAKPNNNSFYGTTSEDGKYISVAVVRKNSGFNSLRDLEGKKACFPSYDGVAWNSALYSLHSKQLLKVCPFTKGMANFFGPCCVPNLPEGQQFASLKSMCKGALNDGDYGAMRCLTHENGDVAFVSKNTFENFFRDIRQKGNVEADVNDYKILCEGNTSPCHLSWAPPGQAMIRSNKTDLWVKDSLDVFLQMDDLFGKSFKSLTTPFTMFGLYDGQANVLFRDATVRLRDVPTSKNTDKMLRQYDTILNNLQECTPAAGVPILPFNIIVYFICSLLLLKIV